MRIVAGRWRGRRIDAPNDERVRPTGDRVREAWMSIVNPWLAGARVLDLFAGSGALGLEALSRGAEVADFVDVSLKSIATLRANAEALGAGAAAVIHRADAMRFVEKLEPHAYDVAFADPPYDLGLATALAERWAAVPFADILGIEHRVSEKLPGGERRKYGGTVITFFRVEG
jgi:16S rRNA (guanine966-N2)-methyltransferase